MKFAFVFLAFLFGSIATLEPSQAMVRGGLTSAPTFIGFLDQYGAQAATEYWSCAYKSTNAYSSSCGIVTRDDLLTQTINFLSNGKGDVAGFNAFCSGHACYLSSWTGQVSGATVTQATLANMPRVIVDENSLLAVCPQPTSSMSAVYNSAVNTAKVHLFAVVNSHFADTKWNQSGLPTNTVTGNLTSGSSGITSMSSQAGISLVSSIGLGTQPGIVDSSNFIPNAPGNNTIGQSYLSALPTGSTGTIGFAVGTQSVTGNKTGDTLSVTNAVLGGPWIMNGPTGSNFLNSAYWGFGLAVGGVAGDWNTVRNTTEVDLQNYLGNGMRDTWQVMDYDTFTQNLNYDGVNLGAGSGSATNIAYSTNVGLTMFANASGSQNLSNTCFETMALFPATEASRVSMAQFLMAQDAISFPFAQPTSDGFAMTGAYQPNNTKANATVYGQANYGPDIYGLTWHPQSGGYTWPSIAFANNINNSATMWRFILEQGDSDINITGAERSEVDASATATAPGQSFSIFQQINFEQLATQNGDWCFTMQLHYNNVSSNSSALFTLSCKGGNLQTLTTKNNNTSTPCGSTTTLTPGTVYAVVVSGFWSTNHTSDTLDVSLGTNGGSLTHVCSTSGALWDNDTGAYSKQGIYRGFGWANAGTAILRVMNAQFNPTTASAYSSYITTQPALPTHP